MNEGIFKILNSNNSGLALSLLHLQDKEITEYEKLLLAGHWVKAGAPADKEMELIGMLGEEWELYIDPFLHKLMNLKLSQMVGNLPMEYDFINKKEFEPHLENIFDFKLDKVESFEAKHGYSIKKELSVNDSNRKILTYQINSKTTNFQLLKVDLEAQGYSYYPRIYIMGTGEDIADQLTEKSLTNLKALMYHMSEEDNWDISMINRCLEVIRFKSVIKSVLVKTIKSKYDR